MRAPKFAMPSAKMSSLVRPFYPALDGLRAVAFLMVFASHHLRSAYDWWPIRWGWVGVDVFFVLSGFLITGILYDSLHRPDYFKSFYIRRALRIFPLFYGTWLILLLLTPFLHIVWNRYNLAMALYLGNFFAASGMMGIHPNPGIVNFISASRPGVLRQLSLGPLWSLCVEEQFYLLWPAVVYFVQLRRALLRVCLGAMALAPLCRALYVFLYPQLTSFGGLYFSFWGRADTLLCGAAIALWLRGDNTSRVDTRRVCRVLVVAAPLLLAVSLRMFSHSATESAYDPVVSIIGFTLIAITSGAALILTIDPSTLLYRLLRWRPLLFTGRISYGLYLFHNIFAAYVQTGIGHLKPYHLQFLPPLIMLALTYLFAVCSFQLLESPFLRLKNKLAPHRGQATDPPPNTVNAAFKAAHT